MEPDCSQELANGSYPEPGEFSLQFFKIINYRPPIYV
jgi:hypothetical protein